LSVNWKAIEALGIKRLTNDSRRVRPGDTFVAYPGETRDGRDYIAQAIANGAAHVLWEAAGFRWRAAWRVPNIGVKGLRRHAGEVASRIHGRPSSRLWMIGVTGTYLYGAPAAGNRLMGVVQFERNRNPLAAKLPGFEFGDANEDTVRSRVELPEDKLDDEGKAEVDVDLASIAKRHSPILVRTTLSLLESGGRPVVRSIERTWWPAPVVVGVRPLFVGDYARENTPAQFEVVRADMKGDLKPGNALPVRLFREDRNYYWSFDDQRGWHSGFTETDELVETSSVSVPAAGRGRLTVPVR